MKRFVIGIVIILVFLFSGSVIAIGWSILPYKYSEKITGIFTPKSNPYQQGVKEAESDLAKGELKIRIYGKPDMKVFPLYEEILLRDYKIHLERVAGCEVTEELMEKTRGYNGTSLRAIESRYGKGILEKVYQQVESQRKP